MSPTPRRKSSATWREITIRPVEAVSEKAGNSPSSKCEAKNVESNSGPTPCSMMPLNSSSVLRIPSLLQNRWMCTTPGTPRTTSASESVSWMGCGELVATEA